MKVTREASACEWLLDQATKQPDASAFVFLDEGETPQGITFANLARRALEVAGAIERVTAPHDRVLLLYEAGLDFVVAFYGCLLAGRIGVPLAGLSPARLERDLGKLRLVSHDATPSLVLTSKEVAASVAQLRASDALVDEALGTTPWRHLGQLELAASTRSPPGLGSIAYLQYTSGSTSRPRGVVVTHDSLFANVRYLCESMMGEASESRFLTWLPHFHDMGLISGFVQPVVAGCESLFMSPAAFLARPVRWLRAISTYRCSNSGGPNFGYEYVLKRAPVSSCEGVDLSCWKTAFNGAEPVRADTIEKFCEAYGPLGFKRSAVYPCYGLAEYTLKAAGGGFQRGVVTASVSARGLETGRLERSIEGARVMVSSGRPCDGLRIVDAVSSRVLGEGEVGEIWLSGPSVTQGYWKNHEATRDFFEARTASGEGPFLRTGDLGALLDGELYVTGRIKDLIIVRGHNHYPQDVEHTVELASDLVRSGCVAAFSEADDNDAKLVVVAEVQRVWVDAAPSADDVARVSATIRGAVKAAHELTVARVVFVAPQSVPKTSSGKVQRQLSRTLLERGALKVVAEAERLPR